MKVTDERLQRGQGRGKEVKRQRPEKDHQEGWGKAMAGGRYFKLRPSRPNGSGK